MDLSGPDRDRMLGDLLHPEREPLVVLERLKAAMGSQAFAAQFQQAPVPAAGNLIKRRGSSTTRCRPCAARTTSSCRAGTRPARPRRSTVSRCAPSEDKGAGTHLIQDLQHSGELCPIACIPEGDKVTRLHAQSVRFESGQVLLPEQAPWLEDFLAELLAFPAGRHDDQVDAVSQALAWAGKRWQGPCMVKVTGVY